MEKPSQVKTPIESLPLDIQQLINALRREAKKYRQKYQDLKKQVSAK